MDLIMSFEKEIVEQIYRSSASHVGGVCRGAGKTQARRRQKRLFVFVFTLFCLLFGVLAYSKSSIHQENTLQDTAKDKMSRSLIVSQEHGGQGPYDYDVGVPSFDCV